MITVGVRELKNRLTHYLRLTRDGERIVVTDHGTPIAIIHELTQVEKGSPPVELLAAAAADGTVRLPLPGSALDFSSKPVVHKGRPASELLLEDRR